MAVACLYLHQDGNAHRGVVFLQLFYQGALGHVLHAHVDGGHNVGTVDGRSHRDLHKLVTHLLVMSNAIGAAQNGVERQFQSAFG